jgi:hypothetical protein
MIIEEALREWQKENISQYCRVCRDTCCDSQKHRIRVDCVSLPLFEDGGVCIIDRSELNRRSLKNWEKKAASKTLLMKDGFEVQKPAVIMGVREKGGFYTNQIYADMCPFYSQESGCRVHEDPRRPKDCVKYPIKILPESDDPTGRFLDIEVMKTCQYREQIKSSIEKRFPIRVID